MLYCKEDYPDNRLICVKNQYKTGINSWQQSAKWFAEKNRIKILEMKDTYKIEDLIFNSCGFDRIFRSDEFTTDVIYNIHFSMLPKYKLC